MYSLMFIAFVKLDYKEACELEETQAALETIIINEKIDFLSAHYMKSMEEDKKPDQPREEAP